MKKAGVVIDAWKLDIFKRHLDAAGYKYEQRNGPTKNVLLLAVDYEWVSKIKPVIDAANEECAAAERKRGGH